MQEIWKPIAGFSGLYEVSSLGNVRSNDREVGHRWGGKAIKRGKLLKPRKDRDGYLFVTLCAGGISSGAKVHRLVAEQNFQKFELRHMTPQHHEADRQGRRQNKAHRSPEPCPENSRDDDRKR